MIQNRGTRLVKLFVTCFLDVGERDGCEQQSLGSKQHLGPAKRLDGAECSRKQLQHSSKKTLKMGRD